jgi:hypothetical protein
LTHLCRSHPCGSIRPVAKGVAFVKAEAREFSRRFASSGRFSGHGFSGLRWRLDVYIDFLGLAAATAEKLAAEDDERGDNDDHKDHQYGHDCGVAAATATTIIISHKIDPPLCTMIRFSSAM